MILKRQSIVFLLLLFALLSCKSKKELQTNTSQHTQKLPQYVIDNRFATALFLGQSALLRNDYLAAQKKFQSCIELRPDNAEALFRLSQTEYKIGNLNKSLDLVAKAIKFDKDDNVWYKLYYADILLENGEALKSVNLLQDIIDKLPSQKFIYVKTDSLWRSLENFKKSEFLWSIYKKTFPNDALFADENLYELYVLENKTNEMLSISKSMYKSDGSNGKYILHYIESLFKAGQRLEAQNLLESYTSKNNIIHSNKEEFYKGAYYLSFELDMSTIALSYAEKVLTSSSDNVFLEHFMNQIKNGGFDEGTSSQTFKELALKNPLNAELQFYTGLKLLNENKAHESIQYFQISKELGNTSFDLFATYCKVLLETNNIKELKKISDDALELYPFSEELQQYNAAANIKDN